MPRVAALPLTWANHVERWRDCRRCPLCDGRKRVCLARGKIPADALFVGEAPGESEDVNGVPFDGPAGQMLDAWVERSGLSDWRCCFTNLTSCIPRDPEESTRKAGEPPDYAVLACLPRLREVIELCQQRSASCGGLQLVVCVGALSATWVRAKVTELGLTDVRIIDIVHPAAILRAPEAKKQLLAQKAVVTLARAYQELVPF